MTADNEPAIGLEKQSDRPAVRASDGDRDRVADILREALAEGRLDAEEHGERIDRVYLAKTVPELEVLIKDLPAGQPRPPRAQPGAGAAQGDPQNVVAILGGADRSGNWRVGSHINAVTVCGGVDLDLTEAIFESPQVTITVTVICGGVDIKVPANVGLRNAGSGILGGFGVREQEPGTPGAPTVLVRGVAICGWVEASAVPGTAITDLRG